MKMKFKCLVNGCGHVVRTRTGIAGHILNHHKKEMIAGKTFEKTRDAVTHPGRNGPFKAKKRKPVAKTVPVFTNATEYIDVPCVLRVGIKGLTVQGLYPS